MGFAEGFPLIVFTFAIITSTRRIVGFMTTAYIKQHKYIIVLFMVSICCVVYYNVDPARYMIMPKCPVKLITTLDCPGCGFQRALHALLHGQFIEAIHYNLFLTIAVPLTLLWWIINMLFHRAKKIVIKKKLLIINTFIIYSYICCYFVWFVIRNIN